MGRLRKSGPASSPGGRATSGFGQLQPPARGFTETFKRRLREDKRHHRSSYLVAGEKGPQTRAYRPQWMRALAVQFAMPWWAPSRAVGEVADDKADQSGRCESKSQTKPLARNVGGFQVNGSEIADRQANPQDG